MRPPKLSIPFIGIFALHLLGFQATSFMHQQLSIPFIGIFALHRPNPDVFGDGSDGFQFPLLGFLLCILAMFEPPPL